MEMVNPFCFSVQKHIDYHEHLRQSKVLNTDDICFDYLKHYSNFDRNQLHIKD